MHDMFLKENILFIERVHSKIKQHIYEKKEKALEWFWKNNSPVLNTLKNYFKTILPHYPICPFTPQLWTRPCY